MTTQQHTKIYLKDYTPPSFDVTKVDLDIQLFDEYATVYGKLLMRRRYDGKLVLLGRSLELQSICVNGKALSADEYTLDDESLTLHDAADELTIETVVRITPQTNTTLEGLYQSGQGDELMFVTQCEPEGFRKITYFPDRPDVLTEYTTRLEAPKRFKTLLANGNLIESGDVGDDRHFSIWHDPTKTKLPIRCCHRQSGGTQ